MPPLGMHELTHHHHLLTSLPSAVHESGEQQPGDRGGRGSCLSKEYRALLQGHVEAEEVRGGGKALWGVAVP